MHDEDAAASGELDSIRARDRVGVESPAPRDSPGDGIHGEQPAIDTQPDNDTIAGEADSQSSLPSVRMARDAEEGAEAMALTRYVASAVMVVVEPTRKGHFMNPFCLNNVCWVS